MDTVDSDNRMNAEHLQPQQHEEPDEEDILSTSIADIDDILQYEGEEVTIDSQQTTATIVDEDTDVYLEISSVDGGTESQECQASHSELAEHVIEDSLNDEMVIVDESTADLDGHSKSPTAVAAMKVESVARTGDERLAAYEAADQVKVSLIKLSTIDEERRTVIMNIRTSDDRMATDTNVATPIAKNHAATEPMCAHTVNLLNNNKIVIRSVKAANSASASPILGKDETPSTARCDKIDENSLHSIAADSTECRMSCDSSSMKISAVNKAQPKHASLDENAMGDSVSGAMKMSSTTIATATVTATPSTSTPKMNRELEMLEKTVNESKVLTEFIIDQSTRGRRSLKASTKRKQQLIPNTSMGSELSSPIIVGETRNESPLAADTRSPSKESDKSGTSGSVQSGAGTNATGKRSTRSQNSDFSAKQRRFLKGIQQVTRGTDDESENSAFDDDEDDIDYDCDMETKQPIDGSCSLTQPKIECEDEETNEEKMSIVAPSDKSDSDTFCWRCHQGECQIGCGTCIRAYHFNCVKVKQSVLHEQDEWQCPECVELQAAESDDKKKFDAQHLSRLLKFAMDRILIDASSRQFQFPFDKKNYPEHLRNTIDLRDIEHNVESMRYTTTEAFLTDIKWILHNCYICCSHNYKHMGAAKSLLKVCKQEMFDIETCAECYLNANTMVDNWFTEVCAKPHLVLWAKLKGFPYWPAKAMTINAQLVDVRFFGDHDRAFVPAKDCYLYSRQDPNPPTNKYKRNTIADCVKEVDIYIENIIAKFGAFNYAELKTPFNPYNELQHLVDMIPGTRSGRPRRRSTAYKSDLRLCIVKTADNNLSIVKKLSDRSPMTSKVIDLVDENSSTPPPHASSSKKRSSESKNKSNKFSPRNVPSTAATTPLADDEGSEFQHKYQVLRRKSMAVEREQHKKVSAVILKRKSISVARAHELDSSLKIDDDDSAEIIPTKRSKSTATAGKKDKNIVADVEIIPKISSSKKQKRLHEQTNTITSTISETTVNDAVSDQVQNDQKVSPKASVETEKPEVVDEVEVKGTEVGSILTSVGLSRIIRKSKDEMKETADSIADDKKTEEENGAKPTNGDEDNVGLRLSKETIEVDAESPIPDKASKRKSVSGRSPRIALVPFIELKEEPKEDTGDTVPQDGVADAIAEASGPPVVKTEPALMDDDSVMIIDEDPAPRPSPPTGVSKLIENIRRGAIAVRDIEKMTNRPTKTPTKSPTKSATEAQRARKTFPRGLQLPASMSNGVTPRVRNQSSNKRLPPMNNMVYIPLDGNSFSRSEVMPSISGPKLTSQPPPLTIVGSTPPTVSSSSITNLCVNGPPPLSVAGASLLINQASAIAPVTPSQTPLQQQPPPPPPPAYSLAVSNSRPFATISSGMLTDQLASAVTESIARTPPKLTSRPTAPLRSDGDTLFPSEAGSVCRTLMENAHRMTDFFRSVIEDTLSDIANTTNPEAKIKLLEMELEKTKFAHAKELMELKANTDTLLNEMKKSMEKERVRTINETRKQCEIERIRSIEETKKKQWCINCGKEAQFYCCWNTSYCDYPCQLQHWSKHTATCTQVENNSSEGNNHRRNNLNTMATKQAKNSAKDTTVSPVVSSSNRNMTASAMRNVFQKNSLLQKFNQFPTTGPNHSTNQRQATTRTMPTSNQQCYAILSHPGTYEVFNTKPTNNLIHSNLAGASVSLSTMRNSNTLIVSSPATINAGQVPSYPMHSTSMPPPLAASKTKQINNETIVIPSD